MKTPETLEPMRQPANDETPLSFEEMRIGWETRQFAKPSTIPDDVDEWPVVQRHKSAGQWKSGIEQPRSVWSGL